MKVGLFTPGEAFEVVAKKRIMKLKEPATKMATLVAEELRIVLFNGLAKVGHNDMAKNTSADLSGIRLELCFFVFL